MGLVSCTHKANSWILDEKGDRYATNSGNEGLQASKRLSTEQLRDLLRVVAFRSPLSSTGGSL